MKINFLKIYTPRLKEQLQFYRDLFGFEILGYSGRSFSFMAGYTEVHFQEKENAKPYHIAFHIPDKQERLAQEWLDNLLEIEKNNNKEIIDFSNWNAKSVYFKDPDGNIMEFISRRDFYKPQNPFFTILSIIGVAEIGLAVIDIEPVFKKLHQYFNLNIFDGDLKQFCPIGDDEGLLITINRNKKDWFPTNQVTYKADFKIKFTHKAQAGSFSFEEDQLHID